MVFKKQNLQTRKRETRRKIGRLVLVYRKNREKNPGIRRFARGPVFVGHFILLAAFLLAVFSSEDRIRAEGSDVRNHCSIAATECWLVVVEIVRRERRWTSAGSTPARELVRSTR
jgi:hypothetical protein